MQTQTTQHTFWSVLLALTRPVVCKKLVLAMLCPACASCESMQSCLLHRLILLCMSIVPALSCLTCRAWTEMRQALNARYCVQAQQYQSMTSESTYKFRQPKKTCDLGQHTIGVSELQTYALFTVGGKRVSFGSFGNLAVW